MSRRIHAVNIATKEYILGSYHRSLLIYIGTPLVAAGLWTAANIESLERAALRKIHGLPRDESGQAIVNMGRYGTPAFEVVDRLAKNVNESNSK